MIKNATVAEVRKLHPLSVSPACRISEKVTNEISVFFIFVIVVVFKGGYDVKR